MSSEYERKLIDMQYQMRENNSYMNDYLQDLNTWTNDIKKREETLKTMTPTTTTKDLPPIRNFIEPPKPKKKKKKKTTDDSKASPTTAPIRSYDYRAWEKYDVDAECNRVENEQAEAEAEEEIEEDDEDDEEWQEEVLKKKAEHYKEWGNHQFKQKAYAQAIEYYTKAIECDPMSPIYFANRAQCQLFEQRFGACEADCTLAIQLDSNYLKAYYRRALARIELNKIDEARHDLEFILAHESSNKDARIKLDELNRFDEIKRQGRVYPLQDKPIEQRSTKPLKRIEIQEIDTSNSSIINDQTTKKKSVIIQEIDQEMEMVTPLIPPQKPPIVEKPPASSSSAIAAKPFIIPTAIPTTGFQFKRDWANLNNQLEQQETYFDAIPPTTYKTLFSAGLDSSVFSRIITIWSKKATIDDRLIDSMFHLCRVSRFDTQLSFLDKNDKQLLKIVLQRLQNECPSTDKIKSILPQLPDVFGQLKKLENVQLSTNQLRAVPASFANLIALRQLNLANNRLTTIPDAILALPNLQLLDLSSNQITQIPDQIRTLQVDELNLNDNRITKISDHIRLCPRLKTLRLDRNNLDLQTIPTSLLTNSNLSLLTFDGNRFDEKAFQGKEGYEQYMERFTASRRKLE